MRVLRRNLMVAGVLLSALPAGFSGTIVVDPGGGGQFTNLQAAIDAANPNDVIHVMGGSHHFVKLYKPLTIVGKPMAEIRTQSPAELFDGCAIDQCAAVGLYGAGVGVVTLANLKIGGCWYADFFGPAQAAIYGGGFEELRVQRCEIVGPVPINHTGTADGPPSIDASVSRLLITDSTIHGSSSTTCDNCFIPSGGPAGVRAPMATVLILDSIIEGGAGNDIPHFLGPMCHSSVPPIPCPCPGIGGAGGPGVMAHTVFVSNSVVTGGQGVAVFDTSSGSPVPWGKQPDGAPFEVSNLLPLPHDLNSSGPLALGAPWSLGVGQPGPAKLLFIGYPRVTPLAVAGVAGWLFVEPTAALLVVPAANVAVIPVTVPMLPSLVGVPVVFQLVEPTSGWTRPVTEVIQP